MKLWQTFWTRFVRPKIMFAGTSSIATIVDYGLFVLLAYSGLSQVRANLISASVGFLVNFIMQKRYIFNLKRPVKWAFAFSLFFSLCGIGISTFLVFLLTKHAWLAELPVVTKLVVTGLMFFYNFYTKQIAFEKRIKW